MKKQELIKKISYIQGLADGIKLSDKSDEGRMISQLIDIINDIVDELSDVNDDIDDIRGEIEELDESIVEVSSDLDALYDIDPLIDDEDNNAGVPLYNDDEDDDDYSFNYDDEEDDGESELFELQCPNCGEDVMIDFDMIDEDSAIICPNCHKDIELEIDYDCDCGCGEHGDNDEE